MPWTGHPPVCTGVCNPGGLAQQWTNLLVEPTILNRARDLPLALLPPLSDNSLRPKEADLRSRELEEPPSWPSSGNRWGLPTADTLVEALDEAEGNST
eukprot:CAMPEP_0115240140 /NCGR_PEP_ID=MMETSP0270-20121206/37758_1 /TAXON_ID=71861 /ORGANISM="Scrippsiella trochoidea, Strain CCMP3099" /LENGTH=97 /DNA_ID=CAMNT_0002655115 /DNA_START=169 /DNA_END=463 /DNA_ORIENTATION=+